MLLQFRLNNIKIETMLSVLISHISYYLSQHPSIVNFRWSTTQAWGATWSFLIFSISTYVASSTTLHLLLHLLLRGRLRGRPIPLGPIPALHSLAMALVSAITFAGMLSSSTAEIRDTRWFWQRWKTPFEWLFCFPIGTRPSGRVFFWSYVFYLSRFLHILRTYIIILQHRRLSSLQLFNHSMLICISFVWLEFSQSFQVLQILVITLALSIVYAYRFWVEIGSRKARFSFLVNFQFTLLVCNSICHVEVLLLHNLRGGCNGMGAWIFNFLLNSTLLLIFLKLHARRHSSKKNDESMMSKEKH